MPDMGGGDLEVREKWLGSNIVAMVSMVSMACDSFTNEEVQCCSNRVVAGVELKSSWCIDTEGFGLRKSSIKAGASRPCMNDR
jgi:hypothetical protein